MSQPNEPTPPTDSVAAMREVLELEAVSGTTFRGLSLDKGDGRVFGGQVLAQAALAAGRTLPDDAEGPRLLHSAQAYFLRPGRVDVPIAFEVERLHDGRSFSTRRTHALQDGTPILAMTASFQLRQPGVDASRTPHDVPGPDECTSRQELFARVDHPAARSLERWTALDVRHVERPVYLAPDPSGAVGQHVWVRFRSPLPQDLDQLTARAMLVYACDELALEPVLRATGLSWLTPGLSLATLDHSMHWLRDVDINRWHLFQQRCVSASGGRGLASADIFDEDGRQVAAFTQEGMVRVPDADAGR